jgi:hypothetical protein
MKIAVIDTISDGAQGGAARAFLPLLLEGLGAKGHDVHLITEGAGNGEDGIEASPVTRHANLWNENGLVEETAPVLAGFLNELNPDVYLIWASEDIGWVALPLLDPQIATLGVGHADSEAFYSPARHYRAFLNRAVGVSPEISVGFVLSSVIEKEKVEWISYDEVPAGGDVQKIIETFEDCFEKAIADALSAPREIYADYPLMETARSRLPMWLRRLKAKVLN